MGTIVPGVQTGKQPTTTESQEPDQLPTGTSNPSASSHRAQILESGWWLVSTSEPPVAEPVKQSEPTSDFYWLGFHLLTERSWVQAMPKAI
ncbi:hypothetical protein E3N88_19269 [Mikania micrantha]|uniref:Uncharacterized protein n=1 Tax=Mikania micrantha TaxID=192012 RepID=A0A5N6NPN6_9ASTR|nr:hypothetical protein E3N88_19269 [Mikania micrantha]